MVTPIRFLPIRRSIWGPRQSQVNRDGSTALCEDEDHKLRNCFLKYGGCMFFAFLVFFIAEYYFYGNTLSIEAMVFCFILMILLLIGGLITLCESAVRSNDSRLGLRGGPTPERENQENVEREMPPQYQMVVLMPATQNTRYNSQNMKIDICESPPPSYENIENEAIEISQKSCQ